MTSQQQCQKDGTKVSDIAKVDHDGKVESFAELEAIVRIIERAENTPVSLKN